MVVFSVEQFPTPVIAIGVPGSVHSPRAATFNRVPGVCLSRAEQQIRWYHEKVPEGFGSKTHEVCFLFFPSPRIKIKRGVKFGDVEFVYNYRCIYIYIWIESFVHE